MTSVNKVIKENVALVKSPSTQAASDNIIKTAFEAMKVLFNRPPKPTVENFNEAVPTGRVEYLGPEVIYEEDLEDMSIYRRGSYINSEENSEEVFMNENFDMRSNFDSAINVENEVTMEMQSPIAEVYTHNNESAEESMVENKIIAKKSMDNKVKYGIGAALAYFLFIKK